MPNCEFEREYKKAMKERKLELQMMGNNKAIRDLSEDESQAGDGDGARGEEERNEFEKCPGCERFIVEAQFRKHRTSCRSYLVSLSL